MNSSLSALGIIHTTVSVLPIGFGVYALARQGKIDPRNWVGKWYLATMLFGSITAFGISKNGGFNAGHVLSAVTLSLLLAGIAANATQWFRRWSKYVETISLSTSFLLLMVFTTTETLTRLPVGHPIANGPDAPILGLVRLGLLLAYLSGVGYQVSQLRASSRREFLQMIANWSGTFSLQK